VSGQDATALDALRSAVGFAPMGERAGNVTVGKGVLDGRALRIAIVENRIASGSIGKAEVARLSPLLAIAAQERAPLVVFLDSAGARVSEGLDALGAFRRLFRDAVAARTAGAPIAAVLGRNCYGGASMLAQLASARLFSPETRLAMSGPAILAQAAGGNALDPMYVAIADAAIGAASRAKTSARNTVWSAGLDVTDWLGNALAPPDDTWADCRRGHGELRERLPAASPAAGRAPESIRRRDLDRLFPDGYEAREADGVVVGSVVGGARLLGLVGSSPVGAARAWAFAEETWAFALGSGPRLEVVLDCESHATRFDDEKAVLSEFIVDMGVALAAARARGAHVQLTILGRAGGGVYVALAAGASRVAAVYGADIQVLPGAAVASILGERQAASGDAEEFSRAGVADDIIKLGLPPASVP
jgi:hypothetical protein